MEEFSEQDLETLINSALSADTSKYLPLGFLESDILSYIYDKLSYKVIGSELNDIFRDLRDELVLSRKVSINLKDLHTLTLNCRKCNLDLSPELPKWNVENPDVLIVIESPSISSEGVSLMVNAFKDAGFSSQDLCLTYINRCPARRKFEPQEIANCLPYIHTEIQLMNPKLVVCLGSIPSGIIFGSPISLKDVHGSVIWLGHFPIISTYSPMYVIKSGGSSSEVFASDIVNAYNFVNSFWRTNDL